MKTRMVLFALLAGCDATMIDEVDGGAPSSRDAWFMRPDVALTDGSYQPRPGSCGLDAPAFCETFEDGPSTTGGRSGELDAARWAVSRGGPGDTAYGAAFRVGRGRVPECRPDATGRLVGPDDDVFVCDPTATIATRHLTTVVASQNYGVHGYRIRQPFDFTGRTGTLAFDADLRGGPLCGFAGITIAGEPTPRPSFGQWEHASGPRDGVEIIFDIDNCHTGDTMSPSVHVFRDYVETQSVAETECFHAPAGHLEHVEVYVSSSHIEVWVSDASPDGITFPNFHLVWAGDVELPFERGHVSLVGYNHATIKYWCSAESVTRWDNVGFDGPVIDGWREHGVPDSLEINPGLEGCRIDGQCVWVGDVVPAMPHEVCDDGDTEGCTFPADAHNVGYRVPNLAEPPLRLAIDDVDPAGASSAALVLYAWYPYFDWVPGEPTRFGLRYRWNGGPWHDRHVSETEARAVTNPEVMLGINQIIDVEVGELVRGTNVLEVLGMPDHTGYPIGLQGIDLRLER